MEEQEKNSRFHDFVRNVENRISNLTTLEIKTIVGDYNVDQNEQIGVKKDGEFRILQSRIDLIQGDITTNISNELVTDKYAWLRDFHARKEERGHEIIDNNVRAIISLFELYRQTKGVNLNEENIDDLEDGEV